MIDYGLDPKLKEIFDYLSKKSAEAYKDVYLLSNETLSKNPFSSSFVKSYLERDCYSIGFFVVVKKILFYYLKNIFVLFGSILNYLIFHALMRPFFSAKSENLIIIDTFFLVDKIIKDGIFIDPYLADLEHMLKKENLNYAYLPIFYPPYNPYKMIKTFRILKHSNAKLIAEFELLNLSAFCKMLLFVFKYPISVMRFLSTLGEDEKDKYLRRSILDGLDDVVISRYSRYLQGLSIGTLPSKNIRLISWFENQTIHKNLYKGIHDGQNNVTIVGAQLFIFSPLYMCAFIDQTDIEYKIAPDKILVNGANYLPKVCKHNFAVGPSLRYKKVFTTNVQPYKHRDKIIILLSYFQDNNLNMLNMLDSVKFDCDVMIKAHPATPIGYYSGLIGSKYEVTHRDIYELANNAKCIISCATGSMIEMAAMGIPILVLKGKDAFDYNPMVNCGKNTIWYEIESAEDIYVSLEKIDYIGNSDEKIFFDIGMEYKKMFFCEPTAENIKKSFLL